MELNLPQGKPRCAKIVVYSDSSWANAHEMKSQAGFCVFIAGENVDTLAGDAASLLDWRSHRIKRQCGSTLAAETMAMDAGMDAGIFCRELLAEMLIESYVPTTSSRSLVSQTAGASTTFW